MKTKIIIILFVLFSALVSCTDNHTLSVNKKCLLKHKWMTNTYIDYSQNSTVDIRNATYSFQPDGTLTKIYENNDTICSVWKISNDGNYLTIGLNTFKITEITNRVMSLRYGEIELFFVSLQ